MPSKVLVVSETQALSDIVSEVLSDSATVTWTPTPNETEGLGIDIVVLDVPHQQENLRQLRVHPRLHHTPAIRVRSAEDIVEHLRSLIARANHPARGAQTRRADTAA